MDDVSGIIEVHPVVFIDNVYNMINDYLCDAADALEEKLCKSTKIAKGPNSVITKGIDQWSGKFMDTLDKNFDKFELYLLNNIFVVPPEVAEHYSKQVAQNSTNFIVNNNNYDNNNNNDDDEDKKMDEEMSKMWNEVEILKQKRQQLYQEVYYLENHHPFANISPSEMQKSLDGLEKSKDTSISLTNILNSISRLRQQVAATREAIQLSSNPNRNDNLNGNGNSNDAIPGNNNNNNNFIISNGNNIDDIMNIISQFQQNQQALGDGDS